MRADAGSSPAGWMKISQRERRRADLLVLMERRNEERRQGERRMDDRAKMLVWLEKENGSPGTFCRAADLSAGGMHVDLGLPQPPGTATRLCFSLPGDSHVFHVTASVISKPV